jgi:hypothetical protein
MKFKICVAMISFVALTGKASADLVTNGGFETSFSGWTTIAASSGSIFGVGGNPHSGNHAAFFAGTTVGSYDQIQQTLATVAGQSYDLTFWLAQNILAPGPPNNFQALVGGVLVNNILNAGLFGYTQFSDTFTATSSSTVLAFRAYDGPSAFSLDDVSVNPNQAAVPEPGSVMLLGTIAGLICYKLRGKLSKAYDARQ